MELLWTTYSFTFALCYKFSTRKCTNWCILREKICLISTSATGDPNEHAQEIRMFSVVLCRKPEIDWMYISLPKRFPAFVCFVVRVVLPMTVSTFLHFRWFLLDFKREFLYDDIFRVWETIWSSRLCDPKHFVLFLALSLVEIYRDIILDNQVYIIMTLQVTPRNIKILQNSVLGFVFRCVQASL